MVQLLTVTLPINIGTLLIITHLQRLKIRFFFRRKIKTCYQKRNNTKKEYPFDDDTIPVWVAPIVLGVAIGLFYAMYANYEALPTPLTMDDQVRAECTNSCH